MAVPVFISWSGEESKFVASHLRQLIKLTCTAAEPWTSADDLGYGSMWSYQLMSQLQATHFGIICLNRGNVNSPWLHFEAGALAKSLDGSAVFPYLIDMPLTELSGPLAQFQAVRADRGGTLSLITALNKILREKKEPSQTDEDLRRLFDLVWPQFEHHLQQAPTIPRKAGPERSNTEVLGELLSLTRLHSRILASVLRPSPGFPMPLQTSVQRSEPAPADAFDSDRARLRFVAMRGEAMDLREQGRYDDALNLLRQADALQPGDLETQIDIAVTETYLPHKPYEESINKLFTLVRGHEGSPDSPPRHESILAKAYYNLACIKNIARAEQGKAYSLDEVFDNLEAAFAGYSPYIDTALADKDLADISSHSRFQELVQRYGNAQP